MTQGANKFALLHGMLSPSSFCRVIASIWCFWIVTTKRNFFDLKGSSMTYTEQVPFGKNEFIDNPEERCPILLLLDTSASMDGRPIRELNDGLITLKSEIMSDSMAVKRAEFAVITFGPPTIERHFQTADVFDPPRLFANGNTPMGAAIEMGLKLIDERKTEYKANGVMYYRPWIFLFTDGAPTDNWQAAAEKVHAGDQNKQFVFRAFATDGADFNTLKQVCPPNRPPLALQGLKFKEFFVWLSKSVSAVSRSAAGTEESVPLPPPTGWGTAA
jgi:uncharacterized protein YegL